MKAGDIKTHSSVHPSVCHKTLSWLIPSEVLMIEHWYLACMITVTSPLDWNHVVTLTFDLCQGQICCRVGDHNSLNLLVLVAFYNVFECVWKLVFCAPGALARKSWYHVEVVIQEMFRRTYRPNTMCINVTVSCTPGTVAKKLWYQWEWWYRKWFCQTS